MVVTRETVQAVEVLAKAQNNGPVSVTQLAQYLGIDKSSMSRRVRGALKSGFLVDHETRRGRPAKLIIGEPLPADQTVLPTVDALRQSVVLHGSPCC